MTTAEYLQTAETLRVQELRHGVVWVARESPTPLHQSLVFELAVELRHYAVREDCGSVWVAPLDVILDASRALIMQPDIFYVSRERSAIVTDHVWGAPDLVVEVLSPHPRIGKIEDRVHWFAQYGVRECWLVHQVDKWIEILTLGDGAVQSRQRFKEHEAVQSPVLPGFAVSLKQILSPYKVC